MSQMHTCANPSRGKLTANPKFCCRSCSAAVTNLTHPKRKPEHHCRNCNASIRSGKTYCSSCSEAFKVEQEKIRSNTRNYKTLRGEVITRPFERVSISKRIVFDTTFFSSSLTPSSSIGELIEHLIGLCLNIPEYLEPKDANRYVSFLHELKNFHTKSSWERNSPTVTVAELPLRTLNRALEEWVFSYFKDDQSGLLPHYALDTVCFMENVIQGEYHSDPEPWQLKPAFGREIAELHLFRFIDAQFKKRFTEFIDLELAAKIPEGASVLDQDEAILTAGMEFVFRVRRCHLSENFYEYSLFEIKEETSRPKFDLMGDFRLKGHIVPQNEDPFSYQQGFPLDLPARWITHEVHYSDRGREHSLRPVPKWLQGEANNDLLPRSD